MRTALRKTIALVLLQLFLGIVAHASEEIRLDIGGQRTVELSRAPRTITISNPNVLDAERVGLTNNLRLVGRGRGRSLVSIAYPDGKESSLSIQVGADEPTAGLGLVSQAGGLRVARELQKVSGLECFVENGRVHVIGTVTSLEGFRTVVRTVMRSPETFFPAFTLSSEIEKAALQSLARDLALSGEPQLQLQSNLGLLFVTGVASSASGHERAMRYVRALFPGAQDALSSVAGGSEVLQIELKFLDVSAGSLTKFGFRAPGTTSPLGVTATFGAGALEPTLQIAPLTALFAALKEKNVAKEIANPVLVTRNGEKARFLAGGEVPIVLGRNVEEKEAGASEKVTFKPYGVSFATTPHLQNDGSVWLGLEVEFSSLDDARSFGGVPAFLSRKVETQIIVRRGEAALLTGLVHSRDAKHVEKFPLLGSIPILGEFFKSRKLEGSESEIWIAVSARTGTPSVQKLEAAENRTDITPSLLD